MPEQFGFQEFGRNCSAVDGNKRTGGTSGMLVDGTSDQFLPGSTFPLNQHGQVRARHSANRLVQLPHRRAGTHQQIRFSGTGLLPFCRRRLAALILSDLLNKLFNDLQVEGLGDVVIRACLHRLDGVKHRILPGHDQHGQIRDHFQSRFRERQAILSGQVDVHQGHMNGVPAQEQPCSFGAFRLMNSIARLSQRLSQHPADAGLIVNNQNLNGISHLSGHSPSVRL